MFVRGEYTKTRSDRTIFLTQELDYQLSSWLSYRYRKRRICYSENGKTVTQYRTPIMKDSDLVFSAHRLSGNPNPVSDSSKASYNAQCRRISLQRKAKTISLPLALLSLVIPIGIGTAVLVVVPIPAPDVYATIRCFVRDINMDSGFVRNGTNENIDPFSIRNDSSFVNPGIK